jgi:Protein of unknown function (DUF3426)
MFINCPYCRTLVSTDPVTDLPPTHCPNCLSMLRRDPTLEDAADASEDAAPMDLAALMNTPRPEAVVETVSAHATETAAEAHAPIEDERESMRDDGSVEATPEQATSDATNGEAEAAAVAIAPARGRRGSRAMPSFARGASAARTDPRERWVPAAIFALALLLVLQLLLADRARLAGDARWRPVLHALCSALFCELPPWREPSAFALLQRDVRQHPNIPGALRVSATFRNDARWPQPWPRLKLTLSDANGRQAGERDFGVEDYLGGPPSQPELASGESATVAMDILEPAPQIVAYDFSFR